jgi:iron complex outermembrane receptor protein
MKMIRSITTLTLVKRMTQFLDSKTLVDVSYGLIDNSKDYSIRAFVKNVTDERYRVSSQPVATLWVFSQYGPPRTAGVEMTFDF